MDLTLQPLTLQHIGAESWLNVGAWSWFADGSPTKVALKFYELHPPLIPLKKVNFRPLARTFGSTPRSLEVWWDGEIAHIICGCDTPAGPNPFRQAYPGLEVEPIKETEPDWVKGLEKQPIFFDLEQMHGLAFCRFIEEHRGEFLDHVLGSLEGCAPAWLQIITIAYNFAPYAEAFANTMDRIIVGIRQGEPLITFASTKEPFKTEFVVHPGEVGSTIGKYGKLISEEAFQKAQLANAIIHVRGLVSDPTTADALSHALTVGVKISYDFAAALPYDDSRLLRWLRARDLPNPEWALANLAQGSFTRKWSTEPSKDRRTLIPAFCCVPSELAIFNCLPTDPELPVQYVRPRPPRVYRPAKKRRGVEL